MIPPDLPFNFCESEIIQVLVGPEPRVFNAHKHLICERIPFFKGALGGDFEESQTKTVTLAEDDPEQFSEIWSWIYQPKLLTIDRRTKRHESLPQMILSRLELYVLADKLCMEDLKNKITDSVRFWLETERTNAGYVVLLRERGLSHSLLQCVLLSQLAYDFAEDDEDDVLLRKDFDDVLELGGWEAVEVFKKYREFSCNKNATAPQNEEVIPRPSAPGKPLRSRRQ